MREMVGIYARISVKHRTRKDNSIAHQLALARQWISSCPEECAPEIYRQYVDEGYSGTGFERPAFQRMLADAAQGKIQCIVCKDASRLGRDYLQVGEYMEKIFPLLGVRLVCVSEGYDSRNEMPGSLTGNLRNLMNEWYARDIGRRVHMAKQQKKARGEYLGNAAPYGYRIVYREGGRYLCREEETAAVVENILRMRHGGAAWREIARQLSREGVQPPAVYRRTGQVYGAPGESRMWDVSSVRRIVLSHTRGDDYPA